MRAGHKTIVHLILKLDVGGLERVMLNCIKQMQQLQPNFKHIVVSLTDANDFSQDELLEPIEVHCLGKKEGNDWRMHKTLYSLFKSIKPEVLHTYNLSTIEYQLVAMLAGVPTRVHAEHGRDINDPQGLNKKHNLLRKLMSFFIHRYIAVSKELYDWLIETVGVSVNKALLITNGIDTTKYNKAKTDSGVIRFINVARLSPIKDHDNLLQACHILSTKQTDLPSWTMTIVGDGPLRQSLETQTTSLSLDDKVSFIGMQSDIPEILRQADVFVLSSIAEGIPMTILEAMAASTPIISTAVGGIPQVVSNGREGILVPNKNALELANAMMRYLQQPEMIKRDGAAARQKVVSQFDERVMVNNYLEVYGQKLEKGQS